MPSAWPALECLVFLFGCLAACHLEGILQLLLILHCSSPGWQSSGSGSFNILASAGLFAVATTVGGALLTDAVDFEKVGVKEGMINANAQLQQLTASSSGGDSKLLLEVVLGLVWGDCYRSR